MSFKKIELVLIFCIALSIILLCIIINKPIKKVDHFFASSDIIQNNNMYNGLYINLKHRNDRKKQIEDEFKKEEFHNFQRFNAFENKKGYLGCSRSHLECLKIAKKNNYKNVIIFEDDFEFLIDKTEFHNLLKQLLTVDYDVFILSYNTYPYNITKTEHPLLHRIKNTQTASGYIVNRKYYDKLIQNFEDGLNLLEKTDEYSKYAIDQYWKPLQETDVWLCYEKRVGKQRESYSDIEKTNVNYQV
jgi:glycosyl transferase family 25